MIVNGDFDKRVVVRGEQQSWSPSPLAGVDRIMLDRIGAEVARATSIVRYAPGSSFSPHVHTGGEEFLVLEGVFQDEHGDFPAGSYVRNPPQSSHTPRSDDGCTIFVKLWQFDLADRTGIHIDTALASYQADVKRPGVRRLVLYGDERETVEMLKLDARTSFDIDASAGMEVFVFSGEISEAGETLEKWAWLRVPSGYRGQLEASQHGATLWLKRDHLKDEITGPVL